MFAVLLLVEENGSSCLESCIVVNTGFESKVINACLYVHVKYLVFFFCSKTFFKYIFRTAKKTIKPQ